MTTFETTPTQTTRQRSGSLVREVVLTIGAIAGLICLVSAIAALAFDVKPLIFRSGSMSPAISTGSLALAKSVPASELSVGDVVSVENSLGTRITHRIDSIGETQGNTSALTLKGDANNTPDSEAYFVSEADRVFFSAPKLGYIASWLSTPSALFAAGLLCALAIFTIIRPSNSTRSSRSRHAKSVSTTHSLIKAAPVALAAATVIALGGNQIQGTKAALTDTASGTSTFTAASTFVTPPTSFNCSTGGFIWVYPSFYWPHLGTGFSYKLMFISGNSAITPITVNVTTTVASGATVVYNDTNNAVPTSFGSPTSVRLYSVFNGQTSTSYRTYTISGTLFNWFGWACGTAGTLQTANVALAAPAPTTTTTAAPTTTSSVAPTTTTAPTTVAPTTTTAPTTVAPTTTTAPTTVAPTTVTSTP